MKTCSSLKHTAVVLRIFSDSSYRPTSIAELSMSVYKECSVGWVIFCLIEVCSGTEVLRSNSFSAITGKSYRPVQEYVIGNGYHIYHANVLQDIQAD
jgi:hypothetical protein